MPETTDTVSDAVVTSARGDADRPVRVRTRTAERFAGIRSSIWAKCLLLAIAWQAGLTVLGRTMDTSAGSWGGGGFLDDLLGHTARWDGAWYRLVIEHGYVTDPLSVAFYPLFPGIVRALQLLTFGTVDVLVLGILVNTSALAFALRALLHLGTAFGLDGASRRIPILLLLTAPAAIFCHLFYTEALFLALGSWAYVFALRGQWWRMGLVLAATTATRLPGVLVVLLCALEFWRQAGWTLRGLLRPAVLWIPFGFLGFGAYALALWAVLGDPLAMFHNVQGAEVWNYHVFDPNFARTILHETRVVVGALIGFGGETFDSVRIFQHGVGLGAIIVLALASAYLFAALRGRGVPLAVFGFATVVLLTLNSNVVSVHRYVFACFVLYLAAGLLWQRAPRARPVLLGAAYLGTLLQGWMLYLFVSVPEIFVA